MQMTLPHLYASAPHPLPFAASLTMRSFLCQRDEGNLLIYASSGLEAESVDIASLGGAARHYLNHGHEAEFVSRAFATSIQVHQHDRGALPTEPAVIETFFDRHRLDSDFEVIPTPGHTPGATAYLWDTGEHRVLFTGDTIFVRNGEWVPALLNSSDPTSYAASLELIRELDFDVLAPWIATAGEPYFTATDPADKHQRINAALQRVRQSADR
jgi:glyoxylase-like metal-dependent hydrolase (beta-lactamase superfamily II)